MATLDKAEALLEELRAASWDAAQQARTSPAAWGSSVHASADLRCDLSPVSQDALSCHGVWLHRRRHAERVCAGDRTVEDKVPG